MKPTTVARRLLREVATELRRQLPGKVRELRRAMCAAIHTKQYERVEEELSDALAKVMDDQIKEASRKLAGQSGTDAEQIAKAIVDVPGWTKDLQRTTAPILALEMARAALIELRAGRGKNPKAAENSRPGLFYSVLQGVKRSTASDFVDEYEIDLPDNILTELPEWMKDEIADTLEESFQQEYWEGISETTRDQLETYLRDGFQDGTSVNDLARQLRDAFPEEFTKQRGLLVARTECLPGDTVVTGADIIAVHKRWYSGPFVEIITEAGRKLSGTPNHPVLTRRGWVGLGDLEESDNLICYRFHTQQFGSSGNVDIEEPPSITINDIFDSFSTIGVFQRRCTTKPDFHGDGIDGYVDIFAADSALSYGTFVSLAQSGIQNILPESDVAQFILAAQGKPLSFRGMYQSTSLGPTSYSSSRFDDDLSNVSIVGPQRFSNIERGFSGDVTIQHLVGPSFEMFGGGSISCTEQELPSLFKSSSEDSSLTTSTLNRTGITSEDLGDFDGAEAGAIEIDHPLVIRRIESWTGHVFNLTTRAGYFIIAEGIYTGNSGHALNAARDMGIRQLKEELGEAGTTIGKSWLSVLGNSTRDAHANLDGVLADDEGMWDLNGVRIPWPSHIDLPPSDRCNCRCSLMTEFGVGASEEEKPKEEEEEEEEEE